MQSIKNDAKQVLLESIEHQDLIILYEVSTTSCIRLLIVIFVMITVSNENVMLPTY